MHLCLDYASGRLDPSHAAIARKARMSERAVCTALQKLKLLGILNWLRRCHEAAGAAARPDRGALPPGPGAAAPGCSLELQLPASAVWRPSEQTWLHLPTRECES